MQVIDIRTLLAEEGQAGLVPAGASRVKDAYRVGDGFQFKLPAREGLQVNDVARIDRGAFIVASNVAPTGEQLHRQVIEDEDWIHIQFRLAGTGQECFSDAQIVETPGLSCFVSRYPRGSVVERRTDHTTAWKVACLHLSPDSVTALLDATSEDLPDGAAWLAKRACSKFYCERLQLEPAMIMAVNDVLTCDFRGASRRAFMRAKSLELLSMVIHALDDRGANAESVQLSASDKQRIATARAYMMAELDGTLTLAQLARQCGVNRTKLAVGFRQLYGDTVQAYWRDIKLSHARDLLNNEGARVTDVALSLGYSELSSFTRAFYRKFGVLPRDCRPMRR